MLDQPNRVASSGGSTVGRLVLSALTRFRERPAVSDGRHSWSYAELSEAIGRIGRFLAGYRQ